MTVEDRASKFRGILYLHLLRTWRYKYSFINYTLTFAFWIAIFLLGALVFVPSEKLPETAPYIFWGVIMWNVMSSNVWNIAGWTWFFLSLGMYEEHKITNTSVLSVLVGRLITTAVDTALVVPIMYAVTMYFTGGKVLMIYDASYVILGFAGIFTMSMAYSLTLSAISFRTGVPGALLDVTNFLMLIMGGIAVPLSQLPEPLRTIATFIPYAHAAELTRYGATGNPTYLPLHLEVAITVVVATSMVAVALLTYSYVENKFLRRYGPRAIGRM